MQILVDGAEDESMGAGERGQDLDEDNLEEMCQSV